MPGKPNAKSKDDLKLTISAIAFTIALAMWNYLSGSARKPPQPTAEPPTPTQQPTVGQTQITPVLIFLGGPPPPTATAVTSPTAAQPTAIQPTVIQPPVAQPQPTRKPRKTVARTGSSKP
jgi:hypothetical protein